MAKAYFSLPDIVEYTLIEKDHLGDRSPEKDLFIVEYIKKKTTTTRSKQRNKTGVSLHDFVVLNMNRNF